MRKPLRLRCPAALAFAIAATGFPAFSRAGVLRVVTYNIEADTDGFTTARPGLDTVLESIGQESVEGNAVPIDILALEETTSNTATVQPIVSDLNSFYGAGTYAMSNVQATQSGSNASGNGPNALIYNTSAVTLLASVGVGTPQGSANGEYRQVMRYEFQPVGGTSAEDFYVYVSHYKEGTTAADLTARNEEAQIIRNNEVSLPTSAHVLYLGDYNLGSSTESSYQTITAAGQGQAFDPISMPGVWADNSSFRGILTESTSDLEFRDDLQLGTQSVLTDPTGLEYIAGSYLAFANNGSISIGGNIMSSTGLQTFANRETILSDMSTASDHLPVIADYAIPTPEPATAALLAIAVGVLSLRRKRCTF